MKAAALGVAFCFALPAAEPGLRAGVARVEITPQTLMPMYGYANRRCGPANGTHDALMAKALVLEAGESRMAIVTLDIGSLVSEKLRHEIAAKLGIPVVLLAASHTHSGPAFLPYGSAPASDPAALAYLAELESKIFRAVRQASEAMFPAKLSAGKGSIQLGYNRLRVREDGRARALFDNLERVPYGPLDPEFTLLRVEDAEGRPRALLVHYATHAVALGPTSCKYSGDWPGAMQRTVESQIEGAQVMFVQGAAGDINPLFMGRSGHEAADFQVMEKMGAILAGEVLKSNRKLEPVPGASIAARSEVLEFGERWEKQKRMQAGITTVLINGQIAIAAVAGEAFNKLQRMWKEQAEAAYPLFYGYTYSSGGTWVGYIPDLRSAAYGGYGADNATRIEVGAGERIMLRHLANLYELMGMWRDAPGRP
jgi:hypothetical protein